MSKLDGKLVIVTSNPGYRDVIYIGFVERQGDLLELSRASMIVRYREVGVSGLASLPEKATRLRPVNSKDGKAWVPLSSVSAIVEADDLAWEKFLGVSID